MIFCFLKDCLFRIFILTDNNWGIICFTRWSGTKMWKNSHIITKMNNNINMDSTIAESVNANSSLTTGIQLLWDKMTYRLNQSNIPFFPFSGENQNQVWWLFRNISTHNYVAMNGFGGPPWSYGIWIYNYLCNQCLSLLTLWVWILLVVRCTWYNIMW